MVKIDGVIQLPKSKAHRLQAKKQRMPLIKCKCGDEILLVPDVEKMSAAIEAHVEVHIKKESDPAEAEITADKIRDNLITQVFKKASESGK